ncbi:RDD family protein [Nocardioides sp.]|uniref:RDD family protein n=1 Tax=Nocardioides sp. TaxID=35761 RepID=UPI00260509E4|nr:RDD family protein [Nocardioides sp.]
MEIWEVGQDEAEIEGLLPDGTPDPAYAKAIGLVQAPLERRVAASLIDVAGWLVLQIPCLILTLPLVLKLVRGKISWFGFTHHPHFVLAMVVLGATAVLSLAYCVANVLLNGARGVTLGKGIVGLRNVNVRTLERPGIGRALLRVLVIWAPAVVVVGPILVLITPLWDSTGRNRGWADLAAGTWMVDIRAGLHPYDVKRMRIARKTHTAEPVDPRAPLPSLTSADAGPVYRPAGRVSAGVLGSTPAGDLRGTPAPARARTPLIPPNYEPPRRVAPLPLWLVLDTGERIEVGTALLLGRGPVSSEATAGATPVAVADTTYSVSKTHLLVRRGTGAGEGVEVVDQGSTNGTAIIRDGVERLLTAGQPARAVLGDTIRFGERTLQVLRAEESA